MKPTKIVNGRMIVDTEGFINEALSFKLGEFYPALKSTELKKVVKIVHADMKTANHDEAATVKALEPFGIAAGQYPRVEQVERDIMHAVVGLGADMEEGIGGIIWSA